MIRRRRSKTREQVSYDLCQLSDEESKAKQNLLSEDWVSYENINAKDNIFLENWGSNFDIQNENYLNAQKPSQAKFNKADRKQFSNTNARKFDKTPLQIIFNEELRKPVIPCPLKPRKPIDLRQAQIDKKQLCIKEKIQTSKFKNKMFEIAEINEALIRKKQAIANKSSHINDYKVNIDSNFMGKTNVCFRSNERKDNLLVGNIYDKQSIQLAGKKIETAENFYSYYEKNDLIQHGANNSEKTLIYVSEKPEVEPKIRERDFSKQWNNNFVQLEKNDFVKIIQNHKQNQYLKETQLEKKYLKDIDDKSMFEQRKNFLSNTLNSLQYADNNEKSYFSNQNDTTSQQVFDKNSRRKTRPKINSLVDASTQTLLKKINSKNTEGKYAKQIHNCKSNDLLYSNDNKASSIATQMHSNKKHSENLEFNKIKDKRHRHISSNEQISLADTIERDLNPKFHQSHTSNLLNYERSNMSFDIKDRNMESNQLKNRSKCKNLSLNDNFEHMATEFLNSIPTPNTKSNYEANIFMKRNQNKEDKKFTDNSKLSSKLQPKQNNINDNSVKNKEISNKNHLLNERIDRLKYFDNRITDKIKTIKCKDRKAFSKTSLDNTFNTESKILTCPNSQQNLNEVASKIIYVKENSTEFNEIFNNHIYTKAALKNYLQKNGPIMLKNGLEEYRPNSKDVQKECSNLQDNPYWKNSQDNKLKKPVKAIQS